MPLDPRIPLMVEPPPRRNLLSDIGQIRQIQRENLALQQEKKAAAAEAFVEDALRRSGGDISKAMPEIMQSYPLYGYDIQQKQIAATTASQDRDLKNTVTMRNLREQAHGEAQQGLVGLMSAYSDEPTVKGAQKEHLDAVIAHLRNSPDPNKELETGKRELGTEAFGGEPIARDILSLIGDETDAEKVIAKLTTVASDSPLRQQYPKLLKTAPYQNQHFLPGEPRGDYDPVAEMNLPPEYDPAAVNAAVGGSDAYKNYLAQQRDERALATPPSPPPNRALEDASKWNTLMSELAGQVTDQASAQAMRQELIGMGAPAGVVARIPASYSKENWQRFLNSTLTEEQRQTQADRVTGRRLEQQRLNQQPGGESDVKVNAELLVSGNLLPSMLSRTVSAQTIAEADRRSMEITGKHYNPVQEQLDFEAAKRFVGSLNGNNMIRFRGLGQSVVNTIDEVRRLSDALKQGGIQLWNRARRDTIQQVYGNTPQSGLAAQYIGAVNTLKEEFANLAQGGFAPTEAAWRLADQQINQNFGFKDMDASLTEVQRLINYRLRGMFDQPPTFIGGGGNLGQQYGGTGGGPGPVGGGGRGAGVVAPQGGPGGDVAAARVERWGQLGLPTTGMAEGQVFTTNTKFPGSAWIFRDGDWERTK